ncbi:universal stress protein [Natrinema halophilum]|uniref:Universal stress protein n=1 Tax=Natrinema halophilum TaxID=1699371 RepID=A0A7D5GR87_9EURY|nr:universal stress protein [Natrinema halophilum]QLG48409.1 universal stress protein [Natrinema halophilum]
MHYLVGTDSVHTTAAICDYLDDRATPDDTVTVISVTHSDDRTARRDGEEALNVASVRLASVSRVETDTRSGTAADALLEAVRNVDADEVIIGAHSGDPDATRDLGSTARRLLEEADRPVVVVPIPEL